MKFKVGDEVKVIGGCHGDLGIYLGKTGIIESIDNARLYPHRIKGFDDTTRNTARWSGDELEPTQKAMTPKEALHAVVDGNTVVSREGTKIYIDNDKVCLEYSNGDKDIIMVPHETWKIYVEPPKPKFTPNSLIYNTDGTIGKVIEDNGVTNGERWYSVCFSGSSDKTKQVKESQLSEYKL